MWLGGLRNALDVGFRPLVDAVSARSAEQAELKSVQRELAHQLQALAAALRDRPG